MIFILGDVHGDWSSAINSYDEAVKRVGVPDMLIQVGDFGYYDGMIKRTKFLWEDHPNLFIDGNHEDHEMLWDDAKEDSRIGTWEYMSRGTFRDGILYIGGASSVDKDWRLRVGAHWSALEDITKEQFDRIMSREYPGLHTVVSHTCPASFDMREASRPEYGGENKDEINRIYLEEVLRKYKPSNWVFGHWHRWVKGRVKYEGGGECVYRCVPTCQILTVDSMDEDTWR